MAGTHTDAPYYGIQQTRTVRKVTNKFREFQSNQGRGTIIVHRVILEDGFSGEIFQVGDKLKRKNGTLVLEGEQICFIPKQTTEIDGLDKLALCADPADVIPKNEDFDEIETKQPSVNKSPSVQGTAIAFSVGYAKDIANVMFKDKNPSAKEITSFIREVAMDLKKIMIENL